MLSPFAAKSLHETSEYEPSFFTILTLSSEKSTTSPLLTSTALILGEIIETSFTSELVF